MSSAWIDVSVPVFSGMAYWPDNPPVQIERMLDMERADAATVLKRSMGAQSSTHMDAPYHWSDQRGQGSSVDPLATLIGPAQVMEISDPVSITAEALAASSIQRGERLLLKTRNAARGFHTKDIVPDGVYLSQVARYIAAQQVQVRGVDSLSVGGYAQDGPETHQALLAAGVWMIEGLHLAAVQPGMYELICLPRKIVGSDGASARAVHRKAE